MEKQNKILIATGIFPPEAGGPASYAQALAKKLAPEKKVAVVTYSRRWGDKTDKFLPFPVIRIWKGWPKVWRHVIYLFRLFTASQGASTILALNTVSSGIPATLVARWRKQRLVVRIVGDYAWETAANTGKTFFLLNDFQKAPQRGKIKLLQNCQRWVCKQADSIIVPSEYLSGIVQGWGVKAEKIKVIYNGVDFPVSELSQEEARKKIGIAGNIILSSGRLVPWKGFKMLIKLMPRLLQINPFFRLVILGSGPDGKTLQAMINNLRLEKKVYLLPVPRAEIPLYLKAASIYVLNTGYEGFSHQILEAMLSRVPVITTRAGGNPEVIRQGENGFMVNYNDEFNLVEAIKTVWQGEELRERFVANGLITVEHFSLEKMFNETMAVLN
ncbi:MAG: hypothetical protein A3I32_02530 [Candidatus Yanofskybacteria bacterium RIFCSPLOWO2_02_FULL_45_10]|uniref:Glycosyl transferase family 1 domain-containing protein n=3 Tax=Patescibacteria group TaxID=1783273 RepID=A0A1F8G2J1_9BACT|nr:MAG: hypothetical protein A3F25_00325 [Candidatus Yanofskybacteria bacterium RIFCSPHIGHO2_12_FULL_45_19b]OGN32251.1 MAG: hypothetical protein A3I32_02530 [Candidatus Yanofskybacteria bacterium RIFCSPLOWO2_02_FULL_45_10]